MDNITSVSWLQQVWEAGFDNQSFLLPNVSVRLAFHILGLSAVIWITQNLVYNLFFHPLAHFPGPVCARASLLWRFWHSMRGRFHRVIDDAHRKYGDVVRVAPNELSFGSATSYRAIYGMRLPGELKVTKDKFYDMFGSGFAEPCLASERDPNKAGQKRGLFAAAFSTKALAEQELVMQRCIDPWVMKLGQAGGGLNGINMVKWYEMVSFDILGEMAFGETFHCVENESSHFWLDIILGHVMIVALMDNLSRYPLLLRVVKALPSSWTDKLKNQQSQFSREKVKRRLEQTDDQRDFLSNITRKVRAGEVSEEEMAAHSSTLVIAGGETTATAMAAVTYYVVKYAEPHAKLKEELRSRFKSLEDIDITSTGQLPYLQAVIKETLRIFSTSPQGLPRRSPGIEVDGHFVPEGTEFSVNPWTPSHDERNFHEPMVFKPERWLDPKCQDNNAAYQPFSLGPRACIGKNFAYAQMSLELAKVVWMYDMELVRKDMNFEAECRMYFFWWKPALDIRFHARVT